MKRASGTSQGGPSLLEHAATRRGDLPSPLADRLRPRTLDEVVGQKHLLGPDSFLRRIIAGDRLVSLILWGPPGVGKTTIAEVIAHTTSRSFVKMSAVLGSIAELREIVSRAEEDRKFRGKGTILFVDEIHRFNRAQQDAFLPHMESGTITLIGATTENPSFSVNRAVLSRAKVLVLEALSDDDLKGLLSRAVRDPRTKVHPGRSFTEEALGVLARAAEGDARRALSLLENVLSFLETEPNAPEVVGQDELRSMAEGELLKGGALPYDKKGDQHYGAASAFIKSMRGSDPDAAIYYMLRMLDAGEDPAFILRRLVIFASEDVGNADPRALPLAESAESAYRRLGMPEGIYPMAHACLYLASCPKSGSVKQAIARARAAIEEKGPLPIPTKLLNAPTALLRELGHGKNYRYAHDYAEGFVPAETYLPEALVGRRFYEPTKHGFESHIAERLARIRASTPGSADRDGPEE
ncbi:MAG: AAA family ATPase [Sorangiineae bacterium NIC37A_2]|nr:MAG: AAA family ATPase [Sorangiineae bacterium NIC37A_2]